MARTAPVPNIPAIPGMNPGVFIMGGGGGGGGGNGRGGRGGANGQGANGQNGGNGAQGGGKGANGSGPGGGGACPNPRHGNRGVSAGDPVDVLTGRVYTLPVVDLALGGPLPLVIQRSYSSQACGRDIGLGRGWSHSLSWEIEERRRSVLLHTPWGPPIKVLDVPANGVALECGRLSRRPWGFSLVDARGVAWLFAPVEGSPRLWRPRRITDPDGNAITLQYRGGSLAGVIDSAGRRVRVSRHRDGHVSAFEVLDASIDQWIAFRRYDYEADLLVRATDGEGFAVHYDYQDGLLTTHTLSGGLRIHYRYDSAGRCVETWAARPDGQDPSLDPSVPELLADRRTRAKGILHAKIERLDDGYVEVITSTAVLRYEGAGGDCTKAVIGGGVHTRQFDATGAITSYEDPLHALHRWRRDEEGKLIEAMNPSGGLTALEYDERGALRQVQDPLGDWVRYERDARGHVVGVDDRAGPVVRYAYTQNGRIAEATLADGGVTRLQYDEMGNRIRVVEPSGAARTMRYDFCGRLLGYVDELGAETRYRYDRRGLLVAVEHPQGVTQHFSYDADRNLTRIVDGDGRATEMLWAGYRVVHAVRRADGSTVCYRYDREQRLVAIVDERGDEHRIERNGAGWVTGETTFDGRSTKYRHDLLGRITEVKVAGEAIEISYDGEGRVCKRSYDDGTSELFEYDALGRLLQATRGDVVCSYMYDARGCITKEVLDVAGHRFEVESTTNSVGDRVARSTSVGHRERVEYDLMGRPLAIRLDGDATVRMRYNALWQEARELPAGGVIHHDTDALGRVRRVSVQSPRRRPVVGEGQPDWVGAIEDGRTVDRGYAYSAGGHLLATRDELRGASYEHRYDALGRVVETVADGRPLESYHYDGAGAVYDGRHRVYGSGGRLLRCDNVELRYDSSGRVVERLTDAGKTSYSYDGRGLLASVTLPDRSEIHFVYDAFARRVLKQVVRDGVTASQTRYGWDGAALAYERLERAVGVERVVRERFYAQEPGGLLPLAHRDVVTVASGRREGPWVFYVCAPNNGFPELLLDEHGEVLQEIERTVWGKTSVAQTALRHPGQYHDEETGLFWNGYRYYDPDLGQYLSPEPRGIEGSLRPYAYVDSFPLWWIDVDGAMRATVQSTRTNSSGTRRPNQPTTASSGGGAPLHPAVAAALPPSQARDPALGDSPPAIGSCAEPAALSQRLYEFQRRTGRMCYPTSPDDQAWRQNLSDALSEIHDNDGIASSDEDGPAAACPNCTQMIGRLWALAGHEQGPPANVVARGRETGVANPRPNVRTSRPSQQYLDNAAANAGIRQDTPPTRPVRPGEGRLPQGGQNYPAAQPFPEQNLGVWQHDDQNGWQRLPGT
ncbi:RHS repeat-associated core domain-containing protein [Sorangium sp. So ce341]|uniref:RHS repeat-associated core domain-containing protein n=1 Tax=Sorangium sp. So ce341 TaxID=3133302 RepID=UPI003F62EFBA